MTPENFEASIQAAQRWAQEEIERLMYAGTRPISDCATVEAATREAAIARGNAIVHSAEIAEIESVLTYVTECLAADLCHKKRPAAPTPLHEDALSRFTELSPA